MSVGRPQHRWGYASFSVSKKEHIGGEAAGFVWGRASHREGAPRRPVVLILRIEGPRTEASFSRWIDPEVLQGDHDQGRSKHVKDSEFSRRGVCHTYEERSSRINHEPEWIAIVGSVGVSILARQPVKFCFDTYVIVQLTTLRMQIRGGMRPLRRRKG